MSIDPEKKRLLMMKPETTYGTAPPTNFSESYTEFKNKLSESLGLSEKDLSAPSPFNLVIPDSGSRCIADRVIAAWDIDRANRRAVVKITTWKIGGPFEVLAIYEMIIDRPQ